MTPVTLHVAAVIAAFLISFPIFYGRKGTTSHKILGLLFTVSMLIGALSSFLISSFGPIHLLSLATIYWLSMGIFHARRRGKNWRYHHAMNMSSA